jgi:hypothetical protein
MLQLRPGFRRRTDAIFLDILGPDLILAGGFEATAHQEQEHVARQDWRQRQNRLNPCQ